MNPSVLLATLIATGTAAGVALPTAATTLPPSSATPMHDEQVAGLFQIIDIAEDVDDLLDGDIGQIDPIRKVTERVGDALDDVNDTIYDVTHINIYEPFTDIDDTFEDFVDDVDDTIRHVSNDLNDWFN